MSKQAPEHRDKLGRVLNVGDCVAYPEHNSLEIGVVTKLNTKMIKVKKVKSTYRASEKHKYSADCVKVDGPDVTMYMLTNATSK